MAHRGDRLAALRRLAVDPGATPPERALAGHLAARLGDRGPTPRAPARGPQRGAGVVLDCSGAFPWLRWRCPSCGEPLEHPGDRLSGAALLALVAALQANEAARCCWFCATGPSALALDGTSIPGAIPAALWEAANPAAADAGGLLVALARARDAYRAGGPRPALLARIDGALRAGGLGAFHERPSFILRGGPGGLRIRWRTPGKAAA